MALIPVVLEFSGVARDSNLNLTLTTEGARWSMGADDVLESEGFSYNGSALGDTRPTCLTAIELTESVIALRTSPSASGTAFSLELFIDVQPEVESVQGHCTLNAGASVVCYLGYDIGAEWRSGQFSAIVRPMPTDLRRVQIKIRNAPVGVPMTIDLMTERSEGEAYLCLDSGVPGAPGLLLRGVAGAPLPLESFTITDRQIVVIPSGTKIAGDGFIELYLRRVAAQPTSDSSPKALKRFHLRVTCDPKAIVVVRVGAQRPVALAASYSCFYF